MTAEALLARITAGPQMGGGKPIIRGMRIAVELVLSLLARGGSTEAVLHDDPDLEEGDIRARFACTRAPSLNIFLTMCTVPPRAGRRPHPETRLARRPARDHLL